MSLLRKPLDVFWRVRIRRLYNSSRFERAAELAMKKVHHPTEAEFARDIVLRSLYNRGMWQQVQDFALEFPSLSSQKYAQKARLKLVANQNYIDKEPQQFHTKAWNSEELLSNWHQEENTLWLRHETGWTFWNMPEGFKLEKTSPSLLHLALEVLLSPWNPEVKNWEVESRSTGKNLALSYSGGIDSTAAALLMPDDIILAYHRRSFDSMLTHDLATNVFNFWQTKLDREVLQIASNHERIRTYHDLQVGFSTANAAAVHLILLADFLDLKGIAFGTPIDNTWLKKGSNYRDFSESHYFNYWTSQFAKAGLEYILPINHISEAGALLICSQSDLGNVVNSCLRGAGTKWCGKCWKCFHKNGPLGREFDPTSKEITQFLNSKPLRTAQHALWALQKQNLEHLAPHLIPHIGVDLSWWEQAYPKGLELLEPNLRNQIKENTEKYLAWMEQPYMLESIQLDV